jgi:hypothetical protein
MESLQKEKGNNNMSTNCCSHIVHKTKSYFMLCYAMLCYAMLCYAASLMSLLVFIVSAMFGLTCSPKFMTKLWLANGND